MTNGSASVVLVIFVCSEVVIMKRETLAGLARRAQGIETEWKVFKHHGGHRDITEVSTRRATV